MDVPGGGCCRSLIIVAVAAPLSATATLAAVGTVALKPSVRPECRHQLPPLPSWSSPSAKPKYPQCGAPPHVACGIADVNPIKTFSRLLTHYALPLLGIGTG